MLKTQPPLELQHRAKQARSAVLHIRVTFKKLVKGEWKQAGSTGTGFIARSNEKGSIILTSAHVVPRKDDPSLKNCKIFVRQMVGKATMARVKEYEATVLRADYVADVAVLKAQSLKRATQVKFSDRPSSLLQKNEPAIAVVHCNPHGLFKETALTRLADISPGQINKTMHLYKNNEIKCNAIVVSCVTTEGCSGGPVFGTTCAIGMVMAGKVGRTVTVCNDAIIPVLRACLPHHMAAGMEDAPFSVEDAASQLL